MIINDIDPYIPRRILPEERARRAPIQHRPLVLNLDYQYPNPLCHRVWFAVTQLATRLQQNNNPERWQGKVILVLAKGVIKTGYTLNLVIAATQLAASFIFGIPIAVSYFIFGRGKHFFWRLDSYEENIQTIMLLQLYLLIKGIYPNKFAQNAYLNHSIRLKEEAQRFYLWEGDGNERKEQVLGFLAERAPKICRDVIEGAARDLALPEFQYESQISFVRFIEQGGFNFYAIWDPRPDKAGMILFNLYLLQEMSHSLNINNDQALELLKGNLNFRGRPIMEPEDRDANRIEMRV